MLSQYVGLVNVGECNLMSENATSGLAWLYQMTTHALHERMINATMGGHLIYEAQTLNNDPTPFWKSYTQPAKYEPAYNNLSEPRADRPRTHCGQTADPLRTDHGHTADWSRTNCGHTADNLRTHCGHTADNLRTNCGHRADIVRTNCGHTADIVRTNCGQTADKRTNCRQTADKLRTILRTKLRTTLRTHLTNW
jgi:hypothetical protein